MQLSAAADLPIAGEFPELDGATTWLNSEPLTPSGLRGKIVVVQFCTFSCVNWLRTLPYVRAWAQKYRDDGLVVIGAHSPEFLFEHDVEKVQHALSAMGIDYPIAMDNDFAVWSAFGNQAWPALYFIDAQGRIRHHHVGEVRAADERGATVQGSPGGFFSHSFPKRQPEPGARMRVLVSRGCQRLASRASDDRIGRRAGVSGDAAVASARREKEKRRAPGTTGGGARPAEGR